MTESEWMSCTDPTAMVSIPMMDFLRGKVSDRKLRSVVIACVRQIPQHLRCTKIENALALAILLADGQGSQQDADDVRSALYIDLQIALRQRTSPFTTKQELQSRIAATVLDPAVNEVLSAAVFYIGNIINKQFDADGVNGGLK